MDNTILTPKCKIWSSKLGYEDFNLLKLYKSISLKRDFFKIVNFPPTTCTQNILSLCKCKEDNLSFLKMKMVEKEHLLVRKKLFILFYLFYLCTIF